MLGFSVQFLFDGMQWLRCSLVFGQLFDLRSFSYTFGSDIAVRHFSVHYTIFTVVVKVTHLFEAEEQCP